MDTVERHNDVLVAADAAARSHDWATLWELRNRLRQTDLWLGYYGPACAVAGWHLHQDAGRALMDELVADGFHQPEMFAEEFAATFATDPGWAEQVKRMRENVPLPKVELLEWPDYPPTLEPVLDRLSPELETRLRDHLPGPAPSAWATALQLLDWVATRWEHANGHLDRRDALEILDRAAQGERFACVEYTVLLSQALNAIGIPARSLSLLMRDHHAGSGRGHVVSEAWIDDLGRWVLLDGQNGAWWGEEGSPLGVLELERRYSEGDLPAMNSRNHELDDRRQAIWFWYFASAKTTGLTWSDGPFIPTFQGTGVVKSDRLVHGTDHVAPDLARIATAVVDSDGPALSFTPVHPFATGVTLRPTEGRGETVHVGLGEPFELAATAGTHAFDVAAVTPYGTLSGSPLRFITR